MFLDNQINNYAFLYESEEKEKVVEYKDLSNSIILGHNRMMPDVGGKGVNTIKLYDTEQIDLSKRDYVLPHITENTFITSDLHLNHKNRNSANFYNIILNDINSKVKLDDWLMFLGDMGKKDDTTQKQYISEFVRKINCNNKILLLGNHDILTLKDYYDMGFAFVGVTLETDKYIFSHCPLDVSDSDKINVHGHIHFEKEYLNMSPERHIDVYIGGHDNHVLRLKDYLSLYEKGFYTGKRKNVDFTKKGDK
jgi:calcineurin-like phosphoesterase family protein